MKKEITQLDGVYVFTPDVYKDNRGYFFESFNPDKIPGLNVNFIQDNESLSNKGVVRGLHWQSYPFPQTKLVRCVSGRIYDIIFCIDYKSPQYGQHIIIELSGENKKQVLIPKGYAHGFIALEDNTIVNYKVDAPWVKDCEHCMNINEATELNLIPGIELIELIQSEKDKQGVDFRDLKVYDLNFNTLEKTK
jgi:dTDP-4-dehydrorhamnose 3,5-epimerase